MGKKTTAVLGASSNPERYSNMAIRMLKENGHGVIPVHPTEAEIEHLPVASALSKITTPIDTVSIYLNPTRSQLLLEELISVAPRRVIFNPGTESAELTSRLEKAGINCVNACTLVLLRTGQY